jgi:hypothetical protein
MIRGVVHGAISLAAISSIACAEDLSTATTPLPPSTFTTSAHSDDWKIANALSAGPASITEHAAVMDWPANPKDGMSHGRVLRQGANGWTCMPDVPGRPQHDPMCVDETMMKWLTATLAGKKPDIDHVGLSYMLLGEARQGQDATPAKEPSQVKEWFYVGPHIMVVLPDSAKDALRASIRISPITSPIHRCSAPQTSRRQSGSFPSQRAATGSRTSLRNSAWLHG